MKRDEREALWTALDALVRRHRTFADTDWALPAEEIDQLAGIAGRLKPTDAVEAHRWLFDTHLPDLGTERGAAPERMQDVANARIVAIRQVLASGGVDDALRLGRSVTLPGFVGVAMAEAGNEQLDERLVDLLDDEDQHLASLAYAYSVQREKSAGWPWIKDRLNALSQRPRAQARLLQVSEDLPEAWHIAEELGPEVERLYWSDFSVMGRGPDFPFVNETAARLLKHGRVGAAIDLMSLYSSEGGDSLAAPELIAQALEGLVDSSAEADELQRLSSYELNVLLERLRETSFDEKRLGLLEWRLLPARGFEARSPVLHRRLARDPAFFVDILSLLYRPHEGADSEADATPEHVARNAWHLLNEWKIVPGSSDQMAPVDEDELMDWITRTRELLAEVDRREIGDIHIGHVFAHARGDDDQTWPTRPVRNSIERIASAEIEDGMLTQTYNNRGVTSRNPAAGGEPERKLATRYRELAALIRDEWPRTGAVLSSLAEGYEREALMHDEDAERIRQGLDE